MEHVSTWSRDVVFSYRLQIGCVLDLLSISWSGRINGKTVDNVAMGWFGGRWSWSVLIFPRTTRAMNHYGGDLFFALSPPLHSCHFVRSRDAGLGLRAESQRLGGGILSLLLQHVVFDL
jgi:hypothetical protein